MKDFLFRYPLLRRALLLLVVYYCVHGAILEIRASQQYKQVAKWPTTEAIIRSSTVYWTSYSWSGKRNRDCPRLEYTYVVNGNIYNATNRVFDFTCWPDAYDLVAQHQPGTSIRVAYDPSDPKVSVAPESIRDPGYPWGDIVGGIVFSGLFLLDLFRSWTRDEAELAQHAGG